MSKLSIIVEGIIGAGKSTYARQLSQALGQQTLYLEEPDEAGNKNPYLGDFYTAPDRWAFTMQVHLLSLRYRMQVLAQWYCMSGQGHAVCDRSYFGDTCFARLLNKTQHITDREYETYLHLYENMTSQVLPPTVCIHLQVPPAVALQRIQHRADTRAGRRVELGIGLDYLVSLDNEINHMVEHLAKQGVRVIHIPWGDTREAEERASAIRHTAESLLS